MMNRSPNDADWLFPLLATLSRGLKARTDRVMSSQGARVGQQFILEALWREDGLTPGELARRIGVETPTVTRAVQRMETAGLVERQPHSTDARLVRVVMTEHGRALHDILPGLLETVAQEALVQLSSEERAVFQVLLERVAANLTHPS